jgi:excisionase family DNA binding protein
MSEEYLTIKEVAQELRMSEKTVYKLVTSGELPSHMVQKRYRISRADLQDFMNKHRKQPPGESPGKE